MSDVEKPDNGSDGFSDEELRRLDSWTAPAPPADFTARVMNRARAQAAPASASAWASAKKEVRRPPMSRAERERRQRRRTALATVLGAVAVSGGGGFVAWQAVAAAGPSAVGGMTVYIGALAFGGILLIASLMGGHDHDADHHVGGDHDQLSEHDPHDHHVGHAARAALVLPFLSVRFWIFGLAFFGLTGVLLRGLGLTSPLLAAVVAAVVGLALGYAAARLFQKLARETVGELAPDGGQVGREGKLLLPVARGQRGKVRVIGAGGATTDLLAESDDERALPAGATVLIVAMRGTVAVVELSPAPSSPSPEQGDRT